MNNNTINKQSKILELNDDIDINEINNVEYIIIVNTHEDQLVENILKMIMK